MADLQTSGGRGFLGHVQQMLQTHPGGQSGLERTALLDCIQACFDCAQACISCADACLAEQNVKEMVRCIRLNQDCADVCETTGRVMSRQTAMDRDMVRTVLQACMAACKLCGDECERHGKSMQHCAVCAEACRRCETACSKLLQAA